MHDLTGTVVAIIDDAEKGRAAVAALAQQQFSAELLHGEDGRAHLNEEDETGFSAAAKKLALAFGDEVRIMDRLDKALQNGRSVVSVDVDDDEDDAARVAVILEEHGGHDMWRLGEWSFNRIGPEGSGEG
ncbi:MAG TPA: hypothetical protein VHM29_07115 [Acidimicrobiia bacterium]|jgi:hypothetical protein|nr:hypothetical protein [Acidimicrobiia bacterium]